MSCQGGLVNFAEIAFTLAFLGGALDKVAQRWTDDEFAGLALTMGGREKQAAREVRQQLWVRPVLIGDGKKGQIEATCIVAREVDAPAGVKPVEWRLLTNRVANTLEQATELIDWYRARWEIEIYFNVLKNGCEVEKL